MFFAQVLDCYVLGKDEDKAGVVCLQQYDLGWRGSNRSRVDNVLNPRFRAMERLRMMVEFEVLVWGDDEGSR